MNLWNIAIAAITFLAPAFTLAFIAWKGKKAPGAELQAYLFLFCVSMLAAAIGVARLERPIQMEFFWPLSLEQSGYFEFSFQLFWPRFVWIFFAGAMFLSHAANSAWLARIGDGKRRAFLFLTGSFFAMVSAFLSENILLSFVFVEFAAFMIHAFSVDEGDSSGAERGSYFKRSCFIFLSLMALLLIAVSNQLSSSSIMLLGVIFYLVSIVLSKHAPTDWAQITIFFLQVGAVLFLMERVIGEDGSSELWFPLTAFFSLFTVAFALLSLISPAPLGASFWMGGAYLGYLLFLRFGSARPGDSFWGTYEALGLAMAAVLFRIFQYGIKIDSIWKRILGFLLVTLVLALVSGAIPGMEEPAIRFDAETGLFRMVMFGFLTFLLSAISARVFVISLSERESSPGSVLPAAVGTLLVLLSQIGMFLRWKELYLDEAAASGGNPLADPRFLLTIGAIAIGLLSGGILGTNGSFAAWSRRRDTRMENFLPPVDLVMVEAAIRTVRSPERAVAWLSDRLGGMANNFTATVERADRGFFGDRFVRRVAKGANALSGAAKSVHSGHVRIYLFLGVFVTILSSFLFLWEGR